VLLISSEGSWAKLISSWQEFPEEFAEVFASFMTGKYNFPYTVYAPSYKWGLSKKTNAKLISIFDNKIIFFEKIKNVIITREYDFKNINYMERGQLLLYSWIKIVGTINGNIIAVVIEFNLVVEHLFEHIIKTLRVSTNNIVYAKNDEISTAEKQKFNYLAKINFKYMNYSKASILPGEKVYSIAYQPLVSKKYFKIFSKIKIFPHILILTETEFIIIQDEKNQLSNYGGIRDYLLLSRIINLKSDFDAKTNYTNLMILFPGGSMYLKFYGIEAELEMFINNFFKMWKPLDS
jgi:hypothetical protein